MFGICMRPPQPAAQGGRFCGMHEFIIRLLGHTFAEVTLYFQIGVALCV